MATVCWKKSVAVRANCGGVVSAFFVSGGLVCLTTYLGTWLSDAFGAGAGEVASVVVCAQVKASASLTA